MLGALQKLAESDTKSAIEYVKIPGEHFPREQQLVHIMFYYGCIKQLEKSNAFLAGGALTSIFTRTKVNDLDIFFPDEKSFEILRKYIKKEDESGSDVVTENKDTRNALTVRTFLEDDGYGEKHKIIHGTEENPYDWEHGVEVVLQLVKPSVCSGSIEEVITTFDFTCCMAGYHFAEDTWYFHPDFFAHLAAKTLVYNELCDRNHMNSLLRFQKYQKKGYNSSIIQLMKLVVCLNERYKTFGEAMHSMTFTNKQLKHLKSCIVSKKYENIEFNYENFLKLLKEAGLNKL